jgi:hypothetical protein
MLKSFPSRHPEIAFAASASAGGCASANPQLQNRVVEWSGFEAQTKPPNALRLHQLLKNIERRSAV